MRSIGIQPGLPVHLILRSGDQQIVHNALVLSLSMHSAHAGVRGEPAISAVYLDETKASLWAGSADWHNSLVRVVHVVHESHASWIEGRAGCCYDEIPRMDSSVMAAQGAHEANRILCAMLGDLSQPEWADAPAWQQDSVVAGAELIAVDPSTTPEASHISWMARKTADGWVYGPVKDPVAKTHPCMMPYDELPPRQRVKDSMFGAVVRGVYSFPQLPVDVSLMAALQPVNLMADASTDMPQPVALVSDASADSATTNQEAAAQASLEADPAAVNDAMPTAETTTDNPPEPDAVADAPPAPDAEAVPEPEPDPEPVAA